MDTCPAQGRDQKHSWGRSGGVKSSFLTWTEIACAIAIVRVAVRIAVPVTIITILVMTVVEISERYKMGTAQQQQE